MSLDTGKPNKVGAEAEPGSLARREANAGGHQIQERERNSRDDGDCQDLLDGGLLHGDDEGGECNGQTLEKILNGTSNKLGNREAVHLILRVKDFYERGCRSFKAGII